MLDLRLDAVSFRHRKSSFAIENLSLRVPRQTHVALIGLPGSGKSTVLELIAGRLRAQSGTVLVGTKDVTSAPARKRPLFHSRHDEMPPQRWSVEHVLVAAARRQQNYDRQERLEAIERAAENWRVSELRGRSFSTLSRTEALRVRLAQIEILRPAVLLAERIFAGANPADLPDLSDRFFALTRGIGATVLSEPGGHEEIGHADQLVVLDRGSIIQTGIPQEIFQSPVSPAAARAGGRVNEIPATVRDGKVSAPIGEWDSGSSLQGPAVAMARPEAFHLVRKGEESDLILSIEDAHFEAGRWLVRGRVTGGTLIAVSLGPEENVHRGRLLPLRFDPAAFILFPAEHGGIVSIPLDAVPPRSESR